jgi:hypothetical protein
MGVPLNHPVEKDLKNNNQPAIGDPPFMEIPTFIGCAFLKPMDLGRRFSAEGLTSKGISIFPVGTAAFLYFNSKLEFSGWVMPQMTVVFFMFNCDVRLMVFLMGSQDSSMDSLSVENDGLLWALRRLGFLWRITSSRFSFLFPVALSNSCGHPLVN